MIRVGSYYCHHTTFPSFKFLDLKFYSIFSHIRVRFTLRDKNYRCLRLDYFTSYATVTDSDFYKLLQASLSRVPIIMEGTA